MSEKERKRLMVFERVTEGHCTLHDAAELLELSMRQTRRLFQRYKTEGAAGLVHKNRVRPSNRAKCAAFKASVLQRYRECYAQYELGPTLATEKLAMDGYALDHETLRRWFLQAGLWSKTRKRRTHRSRREPKARFGELVQMDGSHHRWFGPDHKEACLIVMVDDATKIRLAYLAEGETIMGCMTVLRHWIERYGIPQRLYTDQKNIFVTDRKPTLEEELAGKKPMTTFARACDRLGIGITCANSPQAKGRVERTHGIYQDRFVKELMLQKITTIAEANELLFNGFTDELNAKFALEAADPNDVHRPRPKGLELDEVLCIEHTRVLQNDWTARLHNRIFQIHKTALSLRPGQKILLREHLDGMVSLWWNQKRLSANCVMERQSYLAASTIKPPHYARADAYV